MRKTLIVLAGLLLLVAVPVQAQVTPMGTSKCYDCETGCDPESYPDGSHKMIWSFLFGASVTHECIPYAGCDGHPDCRGGMTEVEADEFFAAVDGAVDGNFEPVLDVIENYPHYAVLNLDRLHLQIHSPCNEDEIAASIPLTSTQVAAVFERQPGIATLASR